MYLFYENNIWHFPQKKSHRFFGNVIVVLNLEPFSWLSASLSLSNHVNFGFRTALQPSFVPSAHSIRHSFVQFSVKWEVKQKSNYLSVCQVSIIQIIRQKRGFSRFSYEFISFQENLVYWTTFTMSDEKNDANKKEVDPELDDLLDSK